MFDVLIIYHSCSGRSKKIALIMGSTLKALVVPVSNFKIEQFRKAKIVGIGSGIYYFRHHKEIFKLVSKLPECKKKIFVFSTSGLSSTVFHKKLHSLLKRKGYEIIGKLAVRGFNQYILFRLIGGISKGCPNEDDFKKTREFCESLKGKYL